VRALLVAAAVLVCAWFALAARQAHDTAHAQAIVAGSTQLGPAEARRAASLLDAAGFLNPDRQVDLVRAQLDLERGLPAQANAVAAVLVRAEPENVQAWLWVAAHALHVHDQTRALDTIARLVPPVR